MTETNTNTTNINEINQSDINTSSLEAATPPTGEDEDPDAVQKRQSENALKHDEKFRLSTFDAVMHIIKGNLGPGILNLPHAFAMGGYIYSSILFFIVVFQGLYSMCLLIYCKYLLQAHFEAARQEKLEDTPMTLEAVTSSNNSNRTDVAAAAMAAEVVEVGDGLGVPERP